MAVVAMLAPRWTSPEPAVDVTATPWEVSGTW